MDKVADHHLGSIKVGDGSVDDWMNDLRGIPGASEMIAGFLTDIEHALTAAGVDNGKCGLPDDNALVLDVDKCVDRTQINGNIGCSNRHELFPVLLLFIRQNAGDVQSAEGEQFPRQRQRKPDDTGWCAADFGNEHAGNPLKGIGTGFVHRFSCFDIGQNICIAHFHEMDIRCVQSGENLTIA